MRFTFLESLCDITHLKPLAIAAEACGFDSFAVPESIMYPRETDSRYPYQSGSREFIAQPMLDPFVSATHMAAVTERLVLTTFVAKLAVRNPVLAAKSACSVAAISGDRFKFGVGLSPWPEDFAVCGQPWENRGKRFDEMLDIVRGLASGDFFEYHGEFFDIPAIRLNPVPGKPMPILLGGHVDAAMRRAALKGDGWMHAGGDQDELAPLLARLQQIRRAEGVERKPFEIHVISMDAYQPEGIRRLEEQGVTDVIVGFRNVYDPATANQPVQEKIDAMRHYADTVIARCR